MNFVSFSIFYLLVSSTSYAVNAACANGLVGVPIKSGDSCWSVATACGWSLNDVYNCNPGYVTACTNLQVGNLICLPSCKSATAAVIQAPVVPVVPVQVPIKSSSGCTCSSGVAYSVKSGDSCWSITNTYGCTVSDVSNSVNACAVLQSGQCICLSTKCAIPSAPVQVQVPVPAPSAVAPPNYSVSQIDPGVPAGGVPAGWPGYYGGAPAGGYPYGYGGAPAGGYGYGGAPAGGYGYGGWGYGYGGGSGAAYTACSQTYTVASGDSCAGILSKSSSGMTMSTFTTANGVDCNSLSVGTSVCLS